MNSTLPMRLLSSSLLSVVLASAAYAEPPPPSAPAPYPKDAECAGFPAPQVPFSFFPGELLEFSLDAMGAQAGKMTMKVLPVKQGRLPVEIRAETNTFFSKVRKASGVATSYLNPKTLRPFRYVEDAVENDVPKYADVTFGEKSADLQIRVGQQSGRAQLRYASEGLDVAGATYLLRQVPLQQDMPVCFDVYGIRRIWRVHGKVLKREHVSLPIGEFEAWHLAATAVRLDRPTVHREVHLWITDDERRLPLAALGTLDIGAVRATLTAFNRPGGKSKRAEGKETIKW